MTRPPYADPTLWDWFPIGFVMVRSLDDHPIAHRTKRRRTDSRWRWEMACNSMSVSSDVNVIRPRWAAHFAVPCLRCWPDAKEGREATVAARAKATP